MLYAQYAKYAIQFNMQNMQKNMQKNMQQYAGFDVLLLIVGNMQNMQYNMQQYAKYVNTISIYRICTPHFADVVYQSI